MSSSTASELAELAGLESAKRVVLGLAAGSPVHAVLFYGVAGSGKRPLARVLTKAWLCVRPLSDGGACGECQACLAFDRDRSADLLWLEPRGKSRILKLAAISPSEVDEDFPVSAQMFLRTPPLAARSKVVVIEDSDRLNASAANSLLKILEEPPPYGRFILLTDAVGSLPSTILSRCLAVACELPGEPLEFEDWVLQLSGSAPGRARTIQENAAAYRPIFDMAISLPRRRKPEALVVADTFARLAEGLREARDWNARSANAEALGVLAAAYALSPERDPAGLQSIVEAHRRILGNANPNSLFDALFSELLK